MKKAALGESAAFFYAGKYPSRASGWDVLA